MNVGNNNACAITDTGGLKCWGTANAADTNGAELGYGDTFNRGTGAGQMGDCLPDINLGIGRTAIAVQAPESGQYDYTCAILDNGKVKCFGLNTSGKLGTANSTMYGHTPESMGENLPYAELGTARTARQIEVGEYDTCAILDNRLVKCWGANSSGALGIGSQTTIGDGAEIGDTLAYTNLGTNRTASDIGGGLKFFCASLDNGQVKCWGEGAYGKLGYGDTINLGDGAGEMGDSLPAVNLGVNRTASEVEAGDHFACALLDTGAVKCWGYNSVGQLGQGDVLTRGNASNQMGDSLPNINIGTNRTARRIYAGSQFNSYGIACAVLDDQSIRCWGSNTSSGQLGIGNNTQDYGNDTNRTGDNIPLVSF